MKPILYPIFLSCRECTNDPFWKKIFEGLAYAETPRGINFKDNTLYSVAKGKDFSYSFDSKEPEEIYENVYNLFHKRYGIKSKGDLSRKRELFEEFQRVNSTRRSEDLWNKIKKKTLKDNLIQDFVIMNKNKYGLSLEESRKLYFYVSVGCTFKVFNGNDISLEGGYIKSINGIEIDSNGVRILREFDEPTIKKESHRDIYLYTLWENFKN